MSGERRYGEAEVAEIFRTAAAPREADRERAPAPAHGLTLAQVQEIGREVGIASARVAEAAAALELRRAAPPVRTSLGMPVSVARSVALPRAPTDREWDVLVAELRETFHAQGRDGTRGALRAWRNGNLHAGVEPTEEGWRFRMATVKGDAEALNRMGIGGLLAAVVLALVLLVTGELGDDVVGPLAFALAGAGALAYNALRLPAWAREREEQMERLAGRARALLEGGAAGEEDV